MIKTFDLKEKNILITGGYGYLGKAVVESLCYHGANVYVLGRNENKFSDSFKSIARCEFEHCDVSSQNSVENAIQKITKNVKNIDVLINNAYYLNPPSSNDLTDSEFTYGLDGVLTSTFRCIKSIIPVFEKQGYGKIINVSSMYGIVSPEFDIYRDFPNYTNPPHYGAAKAGVLQLTRYFASLLAKNNIQVNSITPGPFPSEEVQKASKFIDELKDKTLLKKIGKPEDLAGAFTFLSSEASNYITGQNIIIDGGWTVK